jgi:hypothetical protein
VATALALCSYILGTTLWVHWVPVGALLASSKNVLPASAAAHAQLSCCIHWRADDRAYVIRVVRSFVKNLRRCVFCGGVGWAHPTMRHVFTDRKDRIISATGLADALRGAVPEGDDWPPLGDAAAAAQGSRSPTTASAEGGRRHDTASSVDMEDAASRNGTMQPCMAVLSDADGAPPSLSPGEAFRSPWRVYWFRQKCGIDDQGTVKFWPLMERGVILECCLRALLEHRLFCRRELWKQDTSLPQDGGATGSTRTGAWRRALVGGEPVEVVDYSLMAWDYLSTSEVTRSGMIRAQLQAKQTILFSRSAPDSHAVESGVAPWASPPPPPSCVLTQDGAPGRLYVDATGVHWRVCADL